MPAACSPVKESLQMEFHHTHAPLSLGGSDCMECGKMARQVECSDRTVEQLKRLLEKYKQQHQELRQCVEQTEEELARYKAQPRDDEEEGIALKRQLSEGIQEIARLKIQLHSAGLSTEGSSSRSRSSTRERERSSSRSLPFSSGNTPTPEFPCSGCEHRVKEIQAEVDRQANMIIERTAESMEWEEKCTSKDTDQREVSAELVQLREKLTHTLSWSKELEEENTELRGEIGRKEEECERTAIVARKAALRGDQQVRVGNLEESVLSYSTAIELAKLKPCIGNRAYVHLQLGNAQQCLEDSDAFLSMEGQCDGEIYLYRCKALLQLNRVDEALGDLHRGLKLKPNHPEMTQLLDELQKNRGQQAGIGAFQDNSQELSRLHDQQTPSGPTKVVNLPPGLSEPAHAQAPATAKHRRSPSTGSVGQISRKKSADRMGYSHHPSTPNPNTPNATAPSPGHTSGPTGSAAHRCRSAHSASRYGERRLSTSSMASNGNGGVSRARLPNHTSSATPNSPSRGSICSPDFHNTSRESISHHPSFSTPVHPRHGPNTSTNTSQTSIAGNTSGTNNTPSLFRSPTNTSNPAAQAPLAHHTISSPRSPSAGLHTRGSQSGHGHPSPALARRWERSE